MAKRTDANQKLIVEALRSVGAHVFDAHELGHGFPDLVVSCPYGSTYLVEVKMPGEGLNEKEFIFHRDWPGQIYISHTVEEALSDFEFENILW
jgi:hypothetical protein